MTEDSWESIEARRGADLIRSVKQFAERPGRTLGEALHEQRAADAVSDFVRALQATIVYLKARRDGAPYDGREESELSRLWGNAGNAVSWIDPELARRCIMKGLGWADPDVWERAESKGIKIGIADMEDALQSLLEKKERAMEQKVPSWFPIAGAFFTALTVLFLMYLIVVGPALDPTRQNMLNLLMAFCVAASAAFLGGNAVAKGTIPFFKDSPITFSAIGGVGTFVVVFLILRYAT
jgi:hypothetical protein